MSGRVASTSIAGLALVGVLALAACSKSGGGGLGIGGGGDNGITKLPPDQIVNQVEQAMKSQRTVHVSGQIDNSGMTIGLNVVDGQTRGGGSITVNGATLQTVVDGSTIYLEGDAAAWSKLAGNPSAGQLLAGKWIKTDTSNQDFGQLASLLTIPGLVDALSGGPTPSKGPVTTLNGVRVLTLTTSDGTSYVTTTGSPLLVETKGNGGSQGSGTITFSQYNTATPPADPAGAIDLNTLENGG